MQNNDLSDADAKYDMLMTWLKKTPKAVDKVSQPGHGKNVKLHGRKAKYNTSVRIRAVWPRPMLSEARMQRRRSGCATPAPAPTSTPTPYKSADYLKNIATEFIFPKVSPKMYVLLIFLKFASVFSKVCVQVCIHFNV